MTDSELGVHPCDGCGKADNHPMIHVAFGSWQKDARTFISEPSFHHDCLPAQFRDMLVGPDHEIARQIIAAAESGTHGDELREFILGLDHSVQQPSQEA
jgi:hypothetical protein